MMVGTPKRVCQPQHVVCTMFWMSIDCMRCKNGVSASSSRSDTIVVCMRALSRVRVPSDVLYRFAVAHHSLQLCCCVVGNPT